MQVVSLGHASAALKVLHDEACAVGPGVELKAGPCKTGEKVGIETGDFLRFILVKPLQDGHGGPVHHHICIFSWRLSGI